MALNRIRSSKWLRWGMTAAAFVSAAGCGARAEGELRSTVQAIVSTSTVLLANGSGVRFRESDNWFTTSFNKRVFAANVSGDSATDIVGIDDSGGVWVAEAQGNGYAAPTLRGSTNLAPNNGFFLATERDRVFLMDINGDGRAEIVGVDYNGDVHVSSFNSSGNLTSSTATQVTTNTPFPRAEYFSRSSQRRMYVADINGDGKPDVIGVGNSGQVKVVNTNSSGVYQSTTFLSGSRYQPGYDWFLTTSQPRIWFDDVTGDGKADLIGVDFVGNVYVNASTGSALAADASPVGVSPFSTGSTDGTNWFSVNRHPRIFTGDFDGDGKKDLVGIAPEGVGDGDVWMMRSTGTGFERRVLLHQSIFQTGRGFFSINAHPRVFVYDANNDGRVDLVGVRDNGDLWFGESVREQSARTITDNSYRVTAGPTIRTRLSTMSEEFSGSVHGRVFVGNTGVGEPQDFISIKSDGAIHRNSVAPTRVVSTSAVVPVMLAANTYSSMSVTFSNPMVPASSRGVTLVSCSLSPIAYVAATKPIAMQRLQRGNTPLSLSPCNFVWSADGKTLSYSVNLYSAEPIETVELSLNPSITDARGLTLDHDGDGEDGGLMSRRWIFSSNTVVGTSSRSIVPSNPNTTEAPAYATIGNVPMKSGYDYCRLIPSSLVDTRTDSFSPSLPATNLPKVRAVVIAGGDNGNSSATDGNTSVLLSFDLVGFNATRLAQRIQDRFGIPSSRVIATATHAHAAHRQIRLFHAPHFDDRHATYNSTNPTSGEINDPYVQWVERQALTAVAEALSQVHPVSSRLRRVALSGIGYNRAIASGQMSAWLSANPGWNRASLLEFVDTENTNKVRASIANFALHPVLINGDDGVNADFPGYLTGLFEASNGCSASEHCVSMFINGGAGNIDPDPAWASSRGHSARKAFDQASSIKSQLLAASVERTDTLVNARLRISRTFPSFVGASNCTTSCSVEESAEPRPRGPDALWSLPIYGLSLSMGSSDILHVGTMPGEAFSELYAWSVQGSSQAQATPTLFFGYAHDYDGYLPTQMYGNTAYQNAAWGGYSMGQCVGPTFFTITTGTQVPGNAGFCTNPGTPGESLLCTLTDPTFPLVCGQ